MQAAKINKNLVSFLISSLREEISILPEDFYSSFHYTITGKNLTHPFTIGLLIKVLYQLTGTILVASDCRFNEKLSDNGDKMKFQPDLTVISRLDPIVPLAYIDYESPNSSDDRIPTKDVAAYQNWMKDSILLVPYIIITSLPDKSVPDWEFRHYSQKKCNYPYRTMKDEIRKNPFKFWYSVYQKNIIDLKNVYFINISGKQVINATSLLMNDQNIR